MPQRLKLVQHRAPSLGGDLARLVRDYAYQPGTMILRRPRSRLAAPSALISILPGFYFGFQRKKAVRPLANVPLYP